MKTEDFSQKQAMPTMPDYEEIEIPPELLEYLNKFPELYKEPLKESARFAVFMISVGLVTAIGLASEYVPFLDQIPTDTIVSIGWWIVTLAGIYIASRTFRPGKVAPVMEKPVVKAFIIKEEKK